MADDTRRHWHGTPGNRHEHLNVWTQGGAKGPTTRAAWAMPVGMEEDTKRSPSASSASSTGSNNNSNNDSNNAATASPENSPTIPSVRDRRRSSASSGSAGLFSNLQTQKRMSADPSMAERRASWTEQAQQGGYFSKWWQGYTRGK